MVNVKIGKTKRKYASILIDNENRLICNIEQFMRIYLLLNLILSRQIAIEFFVSGYLNKIKKTKKK